MHPHRQYVSLSWTFQHLFSFTKRPNSDSLKFLVALTYLQQQNLLNVFCRDHLSVCCQDSKGDVRPSVAKMTIFIVIHGQGCVGSEVADEAYPEGSGVVVAGQRCWQSRGSEDAACPGFAHFPLVSGCLDAVLLVGCRAVAGSRTIYSSARKFATSIWEGGCACTLVTCGCHVLM